MKCFVEFIVEKTKGQREDLVLSVGIQWTTSRTQQPQHFLSCGGDGRGIVDAPNTSDHRPGDPLRGYRTLQPINT